MSTRVFWSIIVGFLAGVFLRSLLDISWPVAAFFFLIGVAALAAAYIDGERYRTMLILALALAAASGGILRMDAARLTGDPALHTLLESEVEIEGVVAREPDIRESSARITVDTMSVSTGSTTVPTDVRILVIAPTHTDLSYGDSVRATGTLLLPEPFDSDGGRTFDYPMFLAKDGILYTLAFAEAEGTDESVAWQPGNVAKTLAIGTKQLFLRGLHAAIPEPEAGLASGITVGEKRSMGEDLTEAFTRSSLIHIVVLSGYNITIVINGASRFLECAPRSARFGASGLIVTFFILMTGGAATAVRAGLMALIAVYARTSGRVFLAFRALAFACFVMVAWNPYTLLYDPSFQLSALATLGLILFTPRFVAVLRWVPRKMGMREIVASTIATQLTVLPLLLYQSGNLSLVALPANVLVLAAIPLAMALSAIASVSGLIAPLAAPLFGLPAYALLSYIITVAESFAALPFAAFSVQSFSAWWLIVAYIGIAALYRLFPQGEGAQ